MVSCCIRLGFDVLCFLCCVVWYCVPLSCVVANHAELSGMRVYCIALYSVRYRLGLGLTALDCVVLTCSATYSAVWCCIVLYSIVLCCLVLYRFVLLCVVWYCLLLRCSALL